MENHLIVTIDPNGKLNYTAHTGPKPPQRKLGSGPEAQKALKRTYYLPQDRVRLIRALLYNSRFYKPSNKNCQINLKSYQVVFSDDEHEEWLFELLDKMIVMYTHKDHQNAAELASMREMVEKFNPNSILVTRIDGYFQKVLEELNTNDDLIEDSHLTSIKLLSERNTDPRSKPGILTELKMTKEIITPLAKILGSKYDVVKMFDLDVYEISELLFKMHNDLLRVLQMGGFPEIGLEGQPPLSQTNFKKSLISTFLKSVTPELSQMFFDILSLVKDGKLGVTLKKLNASVSISEKMITGKASKSELTAFGNWLSANLITTAKQSREIKLHISTLVNERKTFTWTLDPWQKQMIEAINNGNNVLVVTPTSSGKTFTAMSSIEGKLRENRETKGKKLVICYVAPSNDLALQTYYNSKLTFPKTPVSIITPNISSIENNTEIWIGTPTELLTFFETIGMNVDVMYIDEIHTISTTYGVDRSKMASYAIGGLMTHVNPTGQLIGLSATIHIADIPRLCEYMTERSGLKLDPKRDVIIHTKRPIKQVNYQWVGETYKLLDEEFVASEVTPESTFKLLTTLTTPQTPIEGEELKQQIPALIFDSDDETCFNNYIKLVDWLDESHKRDYALSISIGMSVNSDILKYNDLMNVVQKEMEESDLSKSGKSSGQTKSLRVNKQGVTLIERIMAKILEAIKTRVDQSIACGYGGHEKAATEDLKRLLGKLGVDNDGDFYPVEIYDMASKYVELNNLKSRVVHRIDTVFDDVGSYYRVGEKSKNIDDMKAMFIPSEGNKALRSAMLDYCAAERIDETEIKPLFNQILKGLSFGVGIILPTLPFVVHANMLKLLNTKSIPVIFTSFDMSMGINYPIRTVVIRSNEPTEMNVSAYLQMAGRSGRRRLDKIGLVISWNIINASRATLENLPHIETPVGDVGSSHISDPIELAIEIETNRIYTLDSGNNSEHLNTAISKLGSKKTTFSKASTKSIINVDDDDGIGAGADTRIVVEYDDVPKKKPGKSEEDILEQMMSSESKEAALISAIGGCINPLLTVIQMNPDDILEIIDRVKNISSGKITEEMRENTYVWAEKIGIVKTALQELHTKLHMCNHPEFLEYISSVYELLHRVQLRQLRL
jgi:superfamily II DNA/RNA helicase